MLIKWLYRRSSIKRQVIPLRLEAQNVLLINENITSEYDIVDCLKKFFLDNFSFSLSITRTAEKYTRQYFEYISTIDYDLDEENDVSKQMSQLDYNFNKVKDFMCKPQLIKDKVNGGYARTCLLCSAKYILSWPGWDFTNTNIAMIFLNLFVVQLVMKIFIIQQICI